MAKEKGRQWDGKSRVSNETYRQRWQDIFGEKNTKEELDKDDQEYLNSLKEKL